MKKAIGLLLVLGLSGIALAGKPENLARQATVTATSEFNDHYLAKYVADGIIPVAGKRTGGGKEWAM